jgi:APA family basic amino acid/polyamine antiporter
VTLTQPENLAQRPSSSESSLRRSIGTFALAAGIVNLIIGAGIFRLPADMAAQLGATAPLAYLLCAVAMGLIALCMAEAGSRVSLTGGAYAYVEVAFGPFAGFLAGFLLWTVLTFAMAAVATVLTANLGVLIPALSSRAAAALALVAIYVGFGTINVLGVERGARVNTALTVAKILPLLLLIAGGVFAIDPANLSSPNPPGMATLARSSLLLLFAFAGAEAALVPGGEVKDPARTVPRALLIGMAVTTALYAALQFVCQGVLGPALATSKAAPLAEAAGVAMGGWAKSVILVGAVISMLGHAGAMILATPACCSRSHAMASCRRRSRASIPRITLPSRRSCCSASSCWCSRSPARSSVSPFSGTCRCSWCTRPVAWPPGSFAAATYEPSGHHFESRPPA